MNINRYLKTYIEKDLSKKMVFLGGPRQVGKTTLAREFTTSKKQYFNWDSLEDREILKSHKINPELGFIVLDEIHKYTRWRMLVKGLYDKYSDVLSILVTGSARLDHFRKGGDSLFGRYHYYRLHPLTLPEIDRNYSADQLQHLLKFRGFPEPFNEGTELFYRRWKRERISRVVYQDLRDLDTVKDLSKIELLVDSLPSRVGSLLSIKSLNEDLEVSPNTVSRWIEVLEAIYYCYRILPMGAPKIRAIKKANKLYLWDWAEVESGGARFENMVASHLLKYCHFLEDTEGHKMELRYLRDIDGREIDFVVIKNKKAIFAVECKTGDKNISSHIQYFKDRVNIPAFYQVHLGKAEYGEPKSGKVLPFASFCKELGLM
ncbi:MAG TPA: AAA family ATPase [Pseudobdellovibrionaceae bacterium]|nr:AAA family ATPase [Pseudobdellovibrionaceae bacterium]